MARSRHSIAATRIALALGAIVFAMAATASAQIDISGNWISSEENLRPRGNAGIGDYTGLPLNDAGRLRADTSGACVATRAQRLMVFAIAALTVVVDGAAVLDGRQSREPGSARAAAPFDPSGVWVSVVTEDWKWRMPTPARGDTLGIPLNETGRRMADSWDHAKDKAAGSACKAYGAGGIMRMPTRLHISWVDGQTLRLETDAGRQTRILHFDPSHRPTGLRSLQGRGAMDHREDHC